LVLIIGFRRSASDPSPRQQRTGNENNDNNPWLFFRHIHIPGWYPEPKSRL
jgi:hypothetical protein